MANKKQILSTPFCSLLVPSWPSMLYARSSNLPSQGASSAPFTYRDRKVMETVSVGIPTVDCLAGGLPRGGLTEICGPPCSGRTSLLLSALASRTAEAEACALVDGRDGFDPTPRKRLAWN